jgi:hypothetical protein
MLNTPTRSNTKALFPPPQTPAAPLDEYVLVPRSTIERLHSHLAAEQERFPARRLGQALKIVQHILAGRTQTRI